MPKADGKHFLLSAEARKLSLRDVLWMTGYQAIAMFRAIRWVYTEGEPVCPHCGCVARYELSPVRSLSARAPVSSSR